MKHFILASSISNMQHKAERIDVAAMTRLHDHEHWIDGASEERAAHHHGEMTAARTEETTD